MIVVNQDLINADNFYQLHIGSLTITSLNTSLSIYAIVPLQTSVAALANTNISINDVSNSLFYMAFSSWDSSPIIGSRFSYSILSDVNNTSYVRLNNPTRIGSIRQNYMIFG